MASTWLCRLCWRAGKFIVELPSPEAMRIATENHHYLVDLDMRAARVPAGMQAWANSEIMDKYPAVDCAGDIRIGESPAAKQRFDKRTSPEFDFEGERHG
jgi:hypothetical protein